MARYFRTIAYRQQEVARAGQLIRRGENTWCIRVYTGRDAHGKRSYINQTVHGTKKEADPRDLRKLLAQRDTGRLHVKPKQSVDEYLDVWLETVVQSVRLRDAARLCWSCPRSVDRLPLSE